MSAIVRQLGVHLGVFRPGLLTFDLQVRAGLQNVLRVCSSEPYSQRAESVRPNFLRYFLAHSHECSDGS